MRAPADSPTKNCTKDGCDRPLRARGLCATHYNQEHQPNRHRKTTMACAACGRDVLKEKSRANRYANVYCDTECLTLYRMERGLGDHLRAMRDARKPRPKKQPLAPTVCKIYLAECRICGTPMASRSPRATYCSRTCSNRARKKRRGKRHNIKREAIFIRDGYVCWLCDQPCDPALQVPHPRAATIDHLMPQSLGGTHEASNLATAHLGCNSRRGAALTWPAAA